jgi:hypothetical protein
MTGDVLESRPWFGARWWAAWCRFWFTPADPTPLCLMRIVAGLLTLYVHVAYTFDLHALFGPDAWVPTAQADRERREWPVFVPQWSWEPRQEFRMPDLGDERHALRVFIENLARNPAGADKAFRLLGSLPTDAEQWLPTMRFLRSLPADAGEREARLADMVKAEAGPDSERRFGRFVLSLPPQAREMFRTDAQVFADLLPADKEVHRHLFDLLLKEGPQGVNAVARFVRNVTNNPKLPDEAARRAYLDYTEYWSAPPDDPDIWHRGRTVYSPFYHVTDRMGINVLHGVHLAVILLFTLGVCTRVTSVLTWLAGLAYIHRNPVALFGQDTMMNLCLFYLMFAPCGATWSIDWLVNRYRAGRDALAAGRRPPVDAGPRPLVSANVVIRLIQINYCMMYLSAGLSKLKGNSWWNGTAVWYTMTNPEFSPLHLPAFRYALVWLCQDHNRFWWEAYMNVMNVFTLTLEIGFPFLVWTRLRPVWVFGAILLHLGIALNMGLVVFSLFMFALLLAWMPAGAIRNVFARPPGRLPKAEVRFASRDPRQRRAAAVVYAADVWNQAELTDRGTDGGPVEVATEDGKATGLEAVCRLLRSLGMTQAVAWPLCVLLRIPGVSHLAAALFGGRGQATPPPPADARKRQKPVASR